MSHQYGNNTNGRGEFQQPMNMFQHRFNAHSVHSSPHLEQQGSDRPDQHSFQCIPPQSVVNLRPPPLPLPPLPPTLQSPSLNSRYGNGFRSVGNETYQRNTINTQQCGSFEDESIRNAQPLHGTQPLHPYHNNGSQPPQPFSYNNNQPQSSPYNQGNQPLPPFFTENQGNQPPQRFPCDQGNQPPTRDQINQPPQLSLANNGNQPARFGIYCSESSGRYFQPPYPSSFQQINSPFLQPIGGEPVRTTPPLGAQLHQEINTTMFSSQECDSLNCPSLGTEKQEEGIASWMKNVQARIDKERNKNETSELKINDVQKKILRYATLVSELDSILRHLLVTARQPDEEEWNSTVKKAEDFKKELEIIRGFFGDQQTIFRMQEILSKRREKRRKWRQGKEKRANKRQSIREDRKKREVKMDEMIKRLNDEEKEKLQEEKMKREADAVLREVRTKQEDVVKMQKLLEALSKLREIRSRKGEMHGYVEDPRANAFFDKMKTEFDIMLLDQQDLYHTEEQTLKIMMEESRTTIPQSKKASHLLPLNLHQLKKSIFEIYFGRNESKDKEYERSFMAAEESVEILVKRRKDWDQFLVSDGSSVPVGWVVPNTDPNKDWKPFQNP